MRLKCWKLNLRAWWTLELCPGVLLALYQLECESCNCDAREIIEIDKYKMMPLSGIWLTL